MDAVVVAALIGGLLLLGFLPFSTDSGIVTLILSVLVTLGLSTIAVLKGKVVLGLAGMLLPPLALIGALRLAKPDSPWGRRRYQPGSAKLARCTARAERHRRRYQRFQDRIAGAPD